MGCISMAQDAKACVVLRPPAPLFKEIREIGQGWVETGVIDTDDIDEAANRALSEAEVQKTEQNRMRTQEWAVCASTHRHYVPS